MGGVRITVIPNIAQPYNIQREGRSRTQQSGMHMLRTGKRLQRGKEFCEVLTQRDLGCPMRVAKVRTKTKLEGSQVIFEV